ncbi:hypothetical protein PanWU01x14_088590, partial [Parasponia andersonii]
LSCAGNATQIWLRATSHRRAIIDEPKATSPELFRRQTISQ